MNFTIIPVDAGRDAPLLHDWMSRDYARFWGMLNASPSDVETEYARIAADPYHHAWLGLEDGTPAFLAESYAPQNSPLAAHYAVKPSDTGMHLLVGPAEQPRAGFTTAVFRSVLDFLFADEYTQRIVVEPDVRNTKIAALNARMGFVPARIISLSDKDALLSFCTRADFRRTSGMTDAPGSASSPATISGVTP
ncbi:GNAT family N-acetyltransferase [Arthrobacter citreus]|jgi:RimJ/RimL family protein N-acetyltransferase|uniref:Lysine N-acyltransferase MbtK n=1 Tax=Arthrobacter citreus TaxID=1670 RepID=A0ABZ2ZUB8_9MICC